MSNHIFLDDRYRAATNAAYEEVERVTNVLKVKPFNSIHEGYAVLLEEVDEMWDDIKKNNTELAVYEAVQVAAMAIRFVAEFGTYPYKKPDRLKTTLNNE